MLKNRMRAAVGLLASLLVMTGCQDASKRPDQADSKAQSSSLTLLEQHAAGVPNHFSTQTLVTMVRQGRLKEASQYVNQALQISPQSAFLHLVNGFIYEEAARFGEDGRRELVSVAYRTARELDGSNWLCAYFYGASQLKERAYGEAQKALSDAALLNPRSPEVWYDLACASYYLGDLPVALVAIEKAVALAPQNPQALRGMAMIAAANRKFAKADHFLGKYEKVIGQAQQDVGLVRQRLQDWRDFHSRTRVQRVNDGLAEGVRGRGGEQGELQDMKDAKNESTIILEGCIMRSVESAATSKGSNIFEQAKPLGIVLGGDATSFDYRKDESKTGGDPWSATVTKTLKFGLTMPALTYGMNIMNASETQFEILVRPVLSTIVGKRVFFVEGTQYTGATDAAGLAGSTITSVDAGTKIEIVPLEVSPNGLVVMDVAITESLFTTPPEANRSTSSQMFSVNQSVVKTTVKAFFGQTVVVGGIYLRSNSYKKSGFPGLQEIPILQYFVSSSQTTSDSRCALCLITPRRGGSPEMDCANGKMENRDYGRGIAQKLARKGFMSIMEMGALYYVLKGIKNSELFSNFRSGDLPGPFFGLTSAAFKTKMDRLKSFLWF